MGEALRARLDREFGDLNKPGFGFGFELDALMRDFMFERFSPHLLPSPRGRAIAVGLQNAREVALIGRHFESQLILNCSGNSIERLAFENPECMFELFFGSPEQLPGYGKFDGAFSIHTFNFVERPEVVLAQMREILSPGGKLFLAVQNAASGTRRMALSMGLMKNLEEISPVARQWGQLRFLDLGGLRALVRMAGFRELDSGGIFLKTLTDAQLTVLMAQGLVGEPYLRALFELGRNYPELCSSVYVVAEKA